MWSIGCRGRDLAKAVRNLRSGDRNTGIIYSNFQERETVMVISRTSSPEEFLNSWEHEKKHLARHIEQAYGIDPFGEEADNFPYMDYYRLLVVVYWNLQMMLHINHLENFYTFVVG